MTDKQPQLLALYARYYNLQQSQQVPEELSIDFNALLHVLDVDLSRILPTLQFRLPPRRCLLLRDSIADAVDECNKEGKVDCARYLGAVLQVDRGKLGDELLHGATGGKQLRLCCHVRELEGLET